MAQPKYHGEEITLGDRMFVLPPMSLGAIKRHRDLLENIGSMNPLAAVEGIASLVHAALSRNYPEITLEEVEDMVDLSNAQKIIESITRVSGLVGKANPGA